ACTLIHFQWHTIILRTQSDLYVPLLRHVYLLDIIQILSSHWIHILPLTCLLTLLSIPFLILALLFLSCMSESLSCLLHRHLIKADLYLLIYFIFIFLFIYTFFIVF